MNSKQLENFTASAAYNLGRDIIDRYQRTGFNFYNECHMAEFRKLSAAATLLEMLGDIRGLELKIEVSEHIHFTPAIAVLEGGRK